MLSTPVQVLVVSHPTSRVAHSGSVVHSLSTNRSADSFLDFFLYHNRGIIRPLGLPGLSPLKTPDQLYWHPLEPCIHPSHDCKYKSQCPASAELLAACYLFIFQILSLRVGGGACPWLPCATPVCPAAVPLLCLLIPFNPGGLGGLLRWTCLVLQNLQCWAQLNLELCTDLAV